jgi:hypothetical protein
MATDLGFELTAGEKMLPAFFVESCGPQGWGAVQSLTSWRPTCARDDSFGIIKLK